MSHPQSLHAYVNPDQNTCQKGSILKIFFISDFTTRTSTCFLRVRSVRGLILLLLCSNLLQVLLKVSLLNTRFLYTTTMRCSVQRNWRISFQSCSAPCCVETILSQAGGTSNTQQCSQQSNSVSYSGFFFFFFSFFLISPQICWTFCPCVKK